MLNTTELLSQPCFESPHVIQLKTSYMKHLLTQPSNSFKWYLSLQVNAIIIVGVIVAEVITMSKSDHYLQAIISFSFQTLANVLAHIPPLSCIRPKINFISANVYLGNHNCTNYQSNTSQLYHKMTTFKNLIKQYLCIRT